MKDFLALFGAATIFVCCAFLLVGLCYQIKEWVRTLKYNYRVKHRFDKPPTAKCYCRDCTRHDNKTQRCYKFKEWLTADSWFCWDAEPRKKEKENA